jgi:molecular chaperone GrpE
LLSFLIINGDCGHAVSRATPSPSISGPPSQFGQKSATWFRAGLEIVQTAPINARLDLEEDFMQEKDRPAEATGPETQDQASSADTGTDDSTQAKDAGPEPEVMPSLEELLKQAELAAKEHHDAWLRSKAEVENMRKRAQIDVANAHKFALENFANELLPVRDSLEAALSSPNLTLESLKSGVELTLKQLSSAFGKVNIKEINPLGEMLDPHKHQAMNTVESDAAPNSIVAVFQKGYELNDRLVRPALVSVAKSKEA